VEGLRFWRLLGTGTGSSTGPGADLRRTALFAVWDDDAALEAFSEQMAASWAGASEIWHVRLRGAGGHGSWRGFDVLGAIGPADAGEGPVAVVTRASVRPGAWRRFRAASPDVDAELAGADGLLAVVAVGEAPIGRLGTFSLWRDLASVRAFSDRPRHRTVVRRTRAERWYGEELFARFVPYASSGSWDGRDPLADTGTSIP
jgi:heme-degrading monooxygenase HmoA